MGRGASDPVGGGGGREGGRGLLALTNAPAMANAVVLRMDLDEVEPRNAEYYLELRNALDRINGTAIF